MQIAGSMSVGHLAPKHTLGLDGVREQARNVSPELTKDNVILRDELRGRSIEEYTNERFQPVIDEYNAKQKRNDRKIKTPYVEWHKNNGNLSQGKVSLAYECVIQIGEHESIGGQYYAAEGRLRERMHDWFERTYKELLGDFEKRFPHLHVLYAALHFDEKDGTPHMHLCFQPEAESSRGLGLQVSIGKALGQDGIERFESRLEAEKEGFQMGRMYREFRHQYINPIITRWGWELKEEIKGRKHDDKSYFKDMMTELDQKAEERNAELDKREKSITETEEKIKAGEKLAVDKMKEAAVKVQAAKEEAAAARQETAAAQRETEGLTQEIAIKQGKVQELEKKIQSKESVAKVKDEINEIYAGPGPHLKYPDVTKSKKGFGKKAMDMVTLPENELKDLYHKADLSEKLRMQTREMEKLADKTIKAADKDSIIQEQREEILHLRKENVSLRVEARQAQEKQFKAEQERDSALDYIENQGMWPGYEHQRIQEEHHHSIHR